MTDTIQAPADTADTLPPTRPPSRPGRGDLTCTSTPPRSSSAPTSAPTCGPTTRVRKSIKERGVWRPVTVYRDEDGQYVLLRGQRRTETAADVGTGPTGLIPGPVRTPARRRRPIGDSDGREHPSAGCAEAEIVAGVGAGRPCSA